MTLDGSLSTARAAFSEGRLDDAIAAFEDVIALDAGHCRAHAGIARCHAQCGRYADAIARARRAIELGPREPWGHVALAIALYQSGQLVELLDAVRAVPRGTLAGEQLGNVLAMVSHARAQLGRDPEGVEELARAAVRVAPELAFVHEALANALVIQERMAEALPSIERAIELEPANPLYRERRDAIRQAVAEAELLLVNLQAQAHGVADITNIAATLYVLGRHDDALVTVERALAMAPDDDRVVHVRVRVMRALGRRDEVAGVIAYVEQMRRRAQQVAAAATEPAKKPPASIKPKQRAKPKPKPKAPVKKPRGSPKPKQPAKPKRSR